MSILTPQEYEYLCSYFGLSYQPSISGVQVKEKNSEEFIYSKFSNAYGDGASVDEEFELQLKIGDTGRSTSVKYVGTDFYKSEKRRTYTDLASELGVSRQRVQQVKLNERKSFHATF